MLSFMFFNKRKTFYFALTCCLCSLFFLASLLWAQEKNSKVPFELIHIENADIRIDGQLDESAWKTVPPLMNWFQLMPDEGEKPSEKTEMRLFYDENAI